MEKWKDNYQGVPGFNQSAAYSLAQHSIRQFVFVDVNEAALAKTTHALALQHNVADVLSILSESNSEGTVKAAVQQAASLLGRIDSAINNISYSGLMDGNPNTATPAVESHVKEHILIMRLWH